MSQYEKDILIGCMSSLAAAISLLENGGRKAAASDKMFDMMMADYRRALDDAREYLRERVEQNH